MRTDGKEESTPEQQGKEKQGAAVRSGNNQVTEHLQLEEFKQQQTTEYIQLDSPCLVLIQNLLSYWEAKTVCQYYYHRRAGINCAVFQTSDASQR